MSLSRSRWVAVWLIVIAALASGVAVAAYEASVKKTTVMVPMHDGVAFGDRHLSVAGRRGQAVARDFFAPGRTAKAVGRGY